MGVSNSKSTEEKEKIFDLVRKKYVIRTPEEDVRQFLLHHLLQELKYPGALIGVEKQVLVNGKRKRFDIVVFKESKPWMIVECKQANQAINKAALMQLLSYNLTLKATYLVLFNGLALLCFDTKNNKWSNELPTFESV